MARSRKQPEPAWDGDYNDEVDNFHEDQEKILLDKAGGFDKARDEYELSDEEVLGVDAESESEEDEKYYDETENQENEQEEEGWGAAKRNYYGADEIEDEEAAKEEEQEALRIQKKHLGELNIEDFYDEDDMDEWKKTAESGVSDVTELPDQDPSLLSKAEKLALLEASHPEVGPLTEELVSLEPKLKDLRQEYESSESQTASIKFAALSTYIGTIYAYFALFVGKVEKGKVDLKNHQVMEGILKARELWRRASEVRDSSISAGLELAEEADEVDVDSEQEEFQDARDSFESDESDEYQEIPSVKRQRVHRESESDSDEFAIAKPKSHVKPQKAKKVSAADDEQETDEEEKEKRKRTLRFYTSKIDQRSNKMDQKAYGGDDDLPYKEREFERRQRLLEEARLRGLKSKVPDEADDFGSDEDDDNTAANGGDSGDLYDLAKANSKQKKDAKKQAHTEAIRAAKEGRLAELDDSLGDGEKRAINYQILKNKGLTPKRRKENRNARVKKRKKYDEAKKKLKSVRAVYQAPTSSYGGESTGIKKNVVRSVHFKA